MAETFAPGDIVRVKSGGPDMVVEVVKDGTVWCVWFVGTGASRKRDSGGFQPVTLEKVDPNRAPTFA